MIFVPRIFWRALFGFALAVSALPLARAADQKSVVGPGASRDDVIAAYGWPMGQSQSGAKEILRYPQGSITLANGRVERVDFSPNIPWPAPRPKPPGPTNSTAKKKGPTPPADEWGTDLDIALSEAARRRVRILAAFTGSDWSPPSKAFLDEVAQHPDFVTACIADFVFLRVDFPTRVAQSPDLKRQNEQLRARCGVTTYPALVVLSARGEPVGVVDLARDRGLPTYRERVVAAVVEVRDLLRAKPVAADLPNDGTASPAEPEAPRKPGEQDLSTQAALAI
ncbi:MAG: hypothetical protein RLZZ15_2272, partial [Verrucomicrobiota bacterium]